MRGTGIEPVSAGNFVALYNMETSYSAIKLTTPNHMFSNTLKKLLHLEHI